MVHISKGTLVTSYKHTPRQTEANLPFSVTPFQVAMLIKRSRAPPQDDA